MDFFNTTEITSYPIQTSPVRRRRAGSPRQMNPMPVQDTFERRTQQPNPKKANVIDVIMGLVSIPTGGKKAVAQKNQAALVLPPNVANYTSVKNGVMLPKNNPVYVSNTDVLTLGGQYELDLQSPEIQNIAKALKPQDVVVVGRAGNIAVPSNLQFVSGKHLTLRKFDNGFIVCDISTNGTQISHKRTNPDEFVRYAGNQGRPIDKTYLQTSKETRSYLNKTIESGEYTSNLENYKRVMNESHKIAYCGMDGISFWYKKHGMPFRMNPYLTRTEDGILSNAYTEEAEKVTKIAKHFGDKFNHNSGTIQKVYLPGIENNALPSNQFCRHFYPSGTVLEQYYAQMFRTAKEAVNLITKHAPQSDILNKLAEHYQYSINARPYPQINNSLYMNEINTLLLKANMKTMPHGNLDHAAHRLQPENFKKYFAYCYNTQGLN